jgi:hypothetical protein
MSDPELEQLHNEVDRAWREWRVHAETGWVVQYRRGDQIVTDSGDPLTPEWRDREADLHQAFEAARGAWLRYRPR